MIVTVWQVDGAWHFESRASADKLGPVSCVHIIRVPAGTRDLHTYVEIPNLGHLNARELVELANSRHERDISIATTVL